MSILTCTVVAIGLAGTCTHPRRISVVLLSLDTFRADHLSCVSPDAPPTPTLDSLAEAGTLFLRAVATSQATTPSHVSIMTGLYCFAHGVYQNSRGLSDEATTLAEVFQASGYRSLGAVSVAHLNPEVANLAQGFNTFLPSHWPGPEGEPASVRTDEVIHRLQQDPPDDRPLFLWVHYFDPHTPYTPPRELPATPRASTGPVRYRRGMGMVAHDAETGMVLDPEGEVARYRGEIAFLDREIGRLLHGLRSLGLLDRAVVAVVGDHGEGLGEHGIFFEHAGMFEPIIGVPLILSGTGIPRGKEVHRRVSTVDLAPTLAAVADVALPATVHGLDLRPLARGRPGPSHEVIFAESFSRRVCAAWEGSMKLMWVPGTKATDWTMPERVMLFDLAADPAESRNVLRGKEMLATRLRDLWAEGVHNPPVRLEPRGGATDMQKLEALGYVQ